jgi:uncharacterized protein (TIGR02246 family)
MKKIRSETKFALALLFSFLSAFTVTAYGEGSAEQEIVKLENAWIAAWKNADSAFLEKLFADEYLSTEADGKTYNKAQELANVKSGQYTHESFEYVDLKIHFYGDTAVVTGQNKTTKAMYKGADISGAHRFTDVFVKRDGRWQVVATQSSVALPKK